MDSSTSRIDWSLCALCQRDGDDLIVPSANLNPDICGYATLARNICNFTKEGLPLPNKITTVISDLKGDTNIADNLKVNKAKWHKGCHQELAPSKFKRALQSAANKKRREERSADAPSKRTRSSLDATTQLQSNLCLYCNEPGLFHEVYVKMKHPPADQLMCRVRTDNCDDFIRKAAEDMGDSMLLAKLSEGNLFARDACYHTKCNKKFRNHYRSFLNTQNDGNAKMKEYESLVLAETMMYIEECLAPSTLSDLHVATSVKLSDIKQFYNRSFSRLVGRESNVNATRLKDKILDLDSNLQAVPDKRDIYISYGDDLAAALKYATGSQSNYVTGICQLGRRIKSELVDRKQSFTGHFEEQCQEQSVSPTFLSFMYMLTGIECPDNVQSSKLSPALVLAQLLTFNSAKKRSPTGVFRSNAEHETPVAIYIAFLIHSMTRSKDLINRLHSLGLCISYDRLVTLSTYLGNNVIDQFEKDGLVCPPSLRSNIFTTHALDNIDHNPSSRTAKDSWHGTAISTSQHRTEEDDGSIRQPVEFKMDELQAKTLKQLPTDYTCISPYVLKAKNIVKPLKDGGNNKVSNKFPVPINFSHTKPFCKSFTRVDIIF